MSKAPYKYLDYYDFEDADIFFGREEEIQRMVGEILSTRLLVLFSPSGSGKTSMINAGVRPRLEEMGYKTIYTRLESEPISAVCRAVANALDFHCEEEATNLYEFLKTAAKKSDKPLVIFLDQFEEFFTVFRDEHKKRKEFIDQLAKIKYDDQLPVFIVLSLREDYFVNLHEFREAIPSIFQNNANLRLENFSDEEARRAIVEPLKAVNSGIEPELVEVLIKDLRNGKAGIEPITLQIVCHTLWDRKSADDSLLILKDYEYCGRSKNILANHVKNILKLIPKRQQGFAVKIFEVLKTGDKTKRYLSLDELQEELKIKQMNRLKNMLSKLTELRLLRCEDKAGLKWYEFKHEYLISEITNWIHWRKEQKMKKRFSYAATPGVILSIGLVIWTVIEYNCFEARFTDQVYAYQQQEVVIERKFNPFGFQVTTGILYNELKNLNIRNAIKNGLIIAIGKKNYWKRLAKIMDRITSGKFLYRIGEHRSGIDILINALKDESWSVRFQAIDALVTLGTADEKVIAALLTTLKDQDQSVRFQAAYVLCMLGKTDERVIAELLAALKNQDRSIRSQAANALGTIGKTDERVTAALLAALKDQDPSVRSKAADALATVGKTDERVIAALLAALKDQNHSVRSQAVDALGMLGKVDERVIAALLGALKDQDRSVRSQAAAALRTLGKADERVITALLVSLNDQYWDVRSQVAAALGMLRKVDERVITALLAALNDQYCEVRSQAAVALGMLGKADERVITALIATLKDQYWDVQFQTTAALRSLETNDERVPTALLKYQDQSGRSQTTAALRKLEKTDKRLIDELLVVLKDKDEDVRFRAAGVLVQLGTTDERVIEALLAALKDQSWDVRSQVADVLGKLLKSKTQNELFEFLKDELSGYRTAGAQALARKDKISEDILKEINRLKNKAKCPWVRLGAWEAYELIHQRLEDEKVANQLIRSADSLFGINKFSKAEEQYQFAFEMLTDIIRVDSLKTGSTKFNQARCMAKLKRRFQTLDNLEIAFQYNPDFRKKLQAELDQKDSDWAFLQDNWYLNEVLLKKATKQ